MNKSELVDRVANASSLAKRDVETVLDAFFDTVKNAVRTGDQVSWPGFGSFKGSQRSERVGRNPRTNEPVNIPASKGMKFTASSALKGLLNPKATKQGSAKKATGKKAPAKKAAKSSKKR